MDTYSIRLFAIDKAIDLAKNAPPTSVLPKSFGTESIIEDAKAIEKYIITLRDKAEPKQE